MYHSGLQKILMTADTIGGVWTYALELTKALQYFAVEVHLATMGKKPDKDQREAAGKLSNLVLHESSFALEWMDHPWEEVEAAGEWLLMLAQKIQPNLIHLNNYVHAALSWHVPVLVVGHSCVLSWWQAVKKEAIPSTWNTYAAQVREGLQKADGVVGVTHSMLDDLHQFYGPLPFSKVIYNAREKSGFRSSAKEPFILSMGRLWDEAKNIQALQNISDQLSWPVYVAGEDHGKLHGKASNLYLFGKLSMAAVTDWLSRASIYSMPARYEPFGLSALEAALSGCALVLGDIPSLREVWGEAALYADPEDQEVLRNHIEKLIQQPDLRKEMAGRAMKRAEKFSSYEMAQQYMATYQQLLRVAQTM